ncbi:hypothetical protein H1W37_02415 [Stappia taiwanensis]|uniref:Uncharacterized protein n=1 Tax=Stappia taiwanensis TaxID=992267 RepID=A0A838XTW0_9HYPH|nr:hypothetical protein [Stappia taiwanensis]MBA4610494.1 hypothetical protein [Stappia taiwanensis]GGE84439.1 hypothetical protein GCM10007285_10100 [Stappia taiwanensis]
MPNSPLVAQARAALPVALLLLAPVVLGACVSASVGGAVLSPAPQGGTEISAGAVGVSASPAGAGVDTASGSAIIR